MVSRKLPFWSENIVNPMVSVQIRAVHTNIYFYIFNNSTVIGHPTLTPRFHNSFCIFYELRRANVSPIRSLILKEIVHVRKNVVINFDIRYSFSLCYQKQTLAVIILLHSFVIISFIKTINCTTQIHQLITFDYFEHQSITEKMRGACGDREKTMKTIFVAEKSNFIRKKVFSGERFRIKGLFYTSYNMAISIQNTMLKVNYFL